MTHDDIHDLVNRTMAQLDHLTQTSPHMVLHLIDPPRTSHTLHTHLIQRWFFARAEQISPSGDLHTAWTSPRGGFLRAMDRLFWRHLEERIDSDTDYYLSHNPYNAAEIFVDREITVPHTIGTEWNDSTSTFNNQIAYHTKDENLCALCARHRLYSDDWDTLLEPRDVYPSELCSQCNEPIKGALT